MLGQKWVRTCALVAVTAGILAGSGTAASANSYKVNKSCHAWLDFCISINEYGGLYAYYNHPKSAPKEKKALEFWYKGNREVIQMIGPGGRANYHYGGVVRYGGCHDIVMILTTKSTGKSERRATPCAERPR